MQKHNKVLVGIIDDVTKATQESHVSVEDIVKSIGHAGFTPLLLMPALAVTTPLSGIPLFSSMMGALIFLVALQLLLRRDHIWLPGWILNLRATSARVQTAFERLRPIMAWLDAHTHTRLTVFVHRPLIFVPQMLCALSGLVMPFLELVPFSSTLIGVAVALLALGMLVRDGLIVAVALVPYLGAVCLFLRLT